MMTDFFIHLHEGFNDISKEEAIYLSKAYSINTSNKRYNLFIPIDKYIWSDMVVSLSVMKDRLKVYSKRYRVIVGSYELVYNSLDKAKKAVEKLENEHINYLFGVRV